MLTVITNDNKKVELGVCEQEQNIQNEQDPKQTIAEKYGVPIEDLNYKAPIEHKSVLNALLNELVPIDFRERGKLHSAETISRKHYLIISNEVILETAQKNRWSLCMSDGFVYVNNSEYWKQMTKEVLLNFLGKGALLMGVDEFEAKHYKFRTELYSQFLSTAYLPKPEKKGNEVLINIKNGTFVITPETQYLRGFDRNDFITHQLGFAYDPDATADKFQKYLDRVLPNKELQMILAEFIGYVFVKQKTLKLEKALILYGSGANGKSVFFEIVIALLGPDNVSNYSLHSLTNENGYYRARLTDKLINYASELSPKMDSTFFKQLVSGEPIEARLPYKDPFLISDYAKLIFNTNILPREIENNEAFYRRFTLVPFMVTIPEEERDASLAQTIINEELAGIFNWVLTGLKRLLVNKRLTQSDIVDRSIEEYRQQSDTVFLFLDEENYTQDLHKEKPLAEIYKLYKEYCDVCGYKGCSRKTFAERLRSLKYIVTRRSQGNMVGISKK
jgi:putative DNA primase/helicase